MESELKLMFTANTKVNVLQHSPCLKAREVVNQTRYKIAMVVTASAISTSVSCLCSHCFKVRGLESSLKVFCVFIIRPLVGTAGSPRISLTLGCYRLQFRIALELVRD